MMPTEKERQSKTTMHEDMKRSADDFWHEVFQQHGEEGRGLHSESKTVSLDELERYLRTESPENLEAGAGLPRRFLLSYIKELDVDRDGSISLDEWRDHVSRRADRRPWGRLDAAVRVFVYAPVYSCRPPPLFTLLITLAQVASFLLTGPHDEAAIEEGAFLDTFMIYLPYKRHEIWRYLLVMFTHLDLMHLAANMITQLIVGIPLEMSQPGWKGSLSVGLVYCAGVVLGTLASSVLRPLAASVGASGGDFALLSAHLAHLALNWREDGNIYKKLPDVSFAQFLNPLVRWMRLVLVLLLLGFELAPIIVPNEELDEDYQIGHMSHLFGAAAGLLLGVFVLENRRVEHWEVKMKWIAFGLFALILVGLTAFSIVATFTTDWFPPLEF